MKSFDEYLVENNVTSRTKAGKKVPFAAIAKKVKGKKFKKSKSAAFYNKKVERKVKKALGDLNSKFNANMEYIEIDNISLEPSNSSTFTVELAYKADDELFFTVKGEVEYDVDYDKEDASYWSPGYEDIGVDVKKIKVTSVKPNGDNKAKNTIETLVLDGSGNFKDKNFGKLIKQVIEDYLQDELSENIDNYKG